MIRSVSGSKDEFESNESSFFGIWIGTNRFFEIHSKDKKVTTNLTTTNWTTTIFLGEPILGTRKMEKRTKKELFFQIQ